MRGGTYSRPRKIYQIRLKGIRFKHFRVLSNISVQIYTLFLTHANMSKAVARTKLQIRKQTSLDVWSPYMSMWLLLRIRITQAFHNLLGFLYCIGMRIQRSTNTDALPTLCDIFRISFVSNVTRSSQCHWLRILTCSHTGRESD